MIKKLNALKNQKGMTLVELLAVMVIIGIIAAISIPAIGTLLENTRKDAAIAEAHAITEAARLYVASEVVNVDTDVLATELKTKGYLDSDPTDPGTKTAYTTAKVSIDFQENGTVIYKVTLQTSGGKYNIIEVDSTTLDRSDVKVS